CSNGLTPGGSTRSKNAVSWKRTGAVSGSRPITAAATSSVGKSATMDEYAVDCARLKQPCTPAASAVRCSTRSRSAYPARRRRILPRQLLRPGLTAAGSAAAGRVGAGAINRSLPFPLLQKLVDGRGFHAAHVVELAGLLGVKDLSIGREYCQGRHALCNGHAVLGRKLNVAVHVPDPDVHQDEVL